MFKYHSETHKDDIWLVRVGFGGWRVPGPAPHEKRHGRGKVPRVTCEIDKQRAEVMIQVAGK